MRIFVISSLFLILSMFAQAQNTCREVIGYYPNWQWYDRANLVNPQSIDYSNYSIINYAFFDVLPDGNLQTLDPWADKNLLLGPINWAVAPAGYESSFDFGNPSYHHPGMAFSDYCHAQDVKLIPSLGGWTLSGNFPAIAADPAKRETFANACVALVQAFNFDGIDIDWEYPGYQPHGGTPNDALNFSLLLQDVREALDVAELSLNRELLLTIAVGASPENMTNVHWGPVEEAVDIINLMSYDYFGAWDQVTNHNSPLYAPASGNPDFNTAQSVDRLINVYGVNPQKIALGIGFYGRSVVTLQEPGLHVPSTGVPDYATFGADEGSPLYYSIVSQINQFETHWDDQAQVPYLTGLNGLNTFVSFDDTLSVRLKSEFAVAHNLRGIIIWEITGDYLETQPGSGIIADTPLSKTIKNTFCALDSEPVCAGDFDGDDYIGVGDLLFMLQSFGCTANCTVDLNGDGVVTSTDFIVFLSLFGTLCE